MGTLHRCLPTDFTLMASGTNSVGGMWRSKTLAAVLPLYSEPSGDESEVCESAIEKRKTETKHRATKNYNLNAKGLRFEQNKTPD